MAEGKEKRERSTYPRLRLLRRISIHRYRPGQAAVREALGLNVQDEPPLGAGGGTRDGRR